MSHLELLTLVVGDYDPAMDFFVNVPRFDPVEDSASLTNDGRAKRRVVVRPRGGTTGILLARADGDDDFKAAYERMWGARRVSLRTTCRAVWASRSLPGSRGESLGLLGPVAGE